MTSDDNPGAGLRDLDPVSLDARMSAIESRVLMLEHTAARLARASTRYREALVQIDAMLLRWRRIVAECSQDSGARNATRTLQSCIDELESIMVNAL